MMGSYRYEYTMTIRKLSRILCGRGIDELICASKNCDDPIEDGDRVISKHGRNGKKIYHKECFEKTFVA